MFNKLNIPDISFENKEKIRTLWKEDHNLNNIPHSWLKRIMLEVGTQLLKAGIKDLSLPELLCITKFTLMKLAGIELSCRPLLKKRKPHLKTKLHLTVSRKRRIWTQQYDFV
jgi:hypothetical protein